MYAYPILAVAPNSDEGALVRALDEGADDREAEHERFVNDLRLAVE